MTAVREMSRRDVLVVGAGPVGLVAACELARHGAPVRLIDRLVEPNPLPRAAGMHPRTQEMLGALGVIGRLGALGRQVPSVEARDPAGGALARIDLRDLPTRFPYLLGVAQSDAEAVLRQRADELGVRVEWGTDLVGLSQDGTGVDVRLASALGEQRARVGFVLGADGSHSTVRSLVGAELATAASGAHFLLTDAEVDSDLPGSEMVLVAGPEGFAAAFPMAAERTRLMFSIPAPQSGAKHCVEDLRALCQERFGGQVRLDRSHWLSSFEARHGQVERYRFGRVLLAGDAAHLHSPAGGHGMNTGMQDAFNLAWKLALVARGRAHVSLLDSYEAERHPVAARSVRETARLSELTAGPAPGGEAMRRLALFAVGHVGRAEQAWAGDLSELGVAYPDSPAVGRGGPAPDRLQVGLGVAPGEYAPAVADLLDRPGHTVLLRSPDPSSAAALGDVLGALGTVTSIMDTPGAAAAVDGGYVAARYGIGADGFVAVRPDGYVGYVATPATTSALRTYLHDHLRAI